MFKFGFGNDKENDSQDCEGDVIKWYPCHKMEIPENIEESVKNVPSAHLTEVDYGSGFKIKCMSHKQVVNDLKESNDGETLGVLTAEGQHSDLIPGIYEGGLKTWECTKDLVDYLIKNYLNDSQCLKDKNVLDLGCGSGILGILALMNGANVTFQDYNQEVLKNLTMPNVFLNIKNASERVHFYSGDWSSFLETLQNNDTLANESKVISPKFDFILSSETIYNPANYDKVYKIIKELLGPEGTAFVVAKCIYFGVGGSIRDFEKHILKENVLESHVCWFTSDGVAREILQIRLKNKGENS